MTRISFIEGSVNEESLVDFIAVIAKYQKKCEVEGNYSEAEKAQKQVQRLSDKFRRMKIGTTDHSLFETKSFMIGCS